jgi:hypothetical protein
MIIDDLIGLVTRPILGVWGIICWLVTAWCEVIVNILSILAWLSLFAAVVLVYLNPANLFAATIVSVISMALFADMEFFKLVEFWLSGKGYTIPPAKFVGEVVGTVFTFIFSFGFLFAMLLFYYPAQWAFTGVILIVSLSVISTIARYVKHFLAMLKDQIGGTSSAPSASGTTQKAK